MLLSLLTWCTRQSGWQGRGKWWEQGGGSGAGAGGQGPGCDSLNTWSRRHYLPCSSGTKTTHTSSMEDTYCKEREDFGSIMAGSTSGLRGAEREVRFGSSSLISPFQHRRQLSSMPLSAVSEKETAWQPFQSLVLDASVAARRGAWSHVVPCRVGPSRAAMTVRVIPRAPRILVHPVHCRGAHLR